MGFKITKLWAAVAVDPADGDEGVCAAMIPGMGWVPLIAADPKRLDWVKAEAASIAKLQGIEVNIVEFDTRTPLETYKVNLDG